DVSIQFQRPDEEREIGGVFEGVAADGGLARRQHDRVAQGPGALQNLLMGALACYSAGSVGLHLVLDPKRRLAIAHPDSTASSREDLDRLLKQRFGERLEWHIRPGDLRQLVQEALEFEPFLVQNVVWIFARAGHASSIDIRLSSFRDLGCGYSCSPAPADAVLQAKRAVMLAFASLRCSGGFSSAGQDMPLIRFIRVDVCNGNADSQKRCTESRAGGRYAPGE